MRLQKTTVRAQEQPFLPVLSNSRRRVRACVRPCAHAHLTRPAGDARLNSARTLASPKAFSRTHKTGKRRGRIGRTPISCKMYLICCINDNMGNVWSGKKCDKKDRFYLELKEIVAGRSEAGCITEKANGVDEEKRSLGEKRGKRRLFSLKTLR